jgi:hypothetical protein
MRRARPAPAAHSTRLSPTHSDTATEQHSETATQLTALAFPCPCPSSAATGAPDAPARGRLKCECTTRISRVMGDAMGDAAMGRGVCGPSGDWHWHTPRAAAPSIVGGHQCTTRKLAASDGHRGLHRGLHLINPRCPLCPPCRQPPVWPLQRPFCARSGTAAPRLPDALRACESVSLCSLESTAAGRPVSGAPYVCGAALACLCAALLAATYRPSPPPPLLRSVVLGPRRPAPGAGSSSWNAATRRDDLAQVWHQVRRGGSPSRCIAGLPIGTQATGGQYCRAVHRPRTDGVSLTMCLTYIHTRHIHRHTHMPTY